MELAWLPVGDWRALLEEAGFEIVACYGWFDLRPYTGGEDSIWLARRPSSQGPAPGTRGAGQVEGHVHGSHGGSDPSMAIGDTMGSDPSHGFLGTNCGLAGRRASSRRDNAPQAAAWDAALGHVLVPGAGT